MMIARISFANRLKRLKTKGRVKLILTVHDSVVVDVELEEDYQAVVNLFHQVFDDIPMNIKKLFGVDWNVPMPCETKLGKNLKDMEKINRNDKENN